MGYRSEGRSRITYPIAYPMLIQEPWILFAVHLTAAWRMIVRCPHLLDQVCLPIRSRWSSTCVVQTLSR